jgi:tetratricopeptide (TPR) repeat protein
MIDGTMNSSGGILERGSAMETRGARYGRAAWVLFFSGLAMIVTACSAKTEEEILSEANAMMQEQNLLKATILYKEFLEKHPDSEYRLAAQMGLAEAYYRNLEYELCREVLDQVIANNGGPASPAGFQPFLTKIRTFMDEERFEDALALAETTSDTMTTAPLPIKQAFQTFLGDLYARNQMLGEALEVYEVILQTEPASVEDELFHLQLLNRSASIHEANGELDKALAMFEDYIADRPEVGILSQLHQSAGRIAQSRGDYENAEAHYDSAEAEFKAAIESSDKEENKVRFSIGLANLQYLRGRTDEGDAALRDIIDTYPNSGSRALAMTLLAGSQARAGDYETAMSLLQQVVTDYPNTQEANQAVQQAQMIRMAREANTATTETAAPAVVTEEALPLDDAPAEMSDTPAETAELQAETPDETANEASTEDDADAPSEP